jgi:thioredoxin reductase
VTIIESGQQLMTREDPDIADEMQRILGGEGIEVLGGAETLNVNGRSGEEVSLTIRTASGEQRIEGSDILVAAGRIHNTVAIGLEAAGVELDARGYIRVNDRLETTAPNVWGYGRMRRQPTVHARLRRRLSDHQGQSRWGEAQHARSAGSLLRVHGPSTRSRRIERGRSAAPRRHRGRRETANEACATDGDDLMKRKAS